MDGVGVVIPAYRPDTERLVTYVESLVDALDPAAVRVELDAATPAVRAELDSLPGRATVHAVDGRRGKGAAITAGFDAIDTPTLAFADADGSTPATSLGDILAPVVAGDADVAVGSRRHPDATVTGHQTRGRRLLGDGFAWLARRLLAVELYDYQCGAKACSRETWTAVRTQLHESGFAWDIEFVAVADALGRTVCEVPVEWRDQPGSTVSPATDTLRIARGLLVSRHRARLLEGDRLHTALATRAGNRSPLVDRAPVED